mgnify:CR=1 FL=1
MQVAQNEQLLEPDHRQTFGYANFHEMLHHLFHIVEDFFW